MIRTISLNGSWRFAPDLEQRPTNNANLTGGSVPIYAYPDLCRRDWQLVPVPGVWERYGERYSIYEGVCWYCRTFSVSGLTETTAARLRFKGVAYRADIWINGKAAGWHESAYTEFTIGVTGLLREGENFIAVRVDNRALLMKWPNDRGYFAYGGIHRDVMLELADGDRAEDLAVTPTLRRQADGGRTGVLRISGRVRGRAGLPLTVTLDGKTKELSVCPDADGRFDAEVTWEDVKPWSPDDPQLSELTVSYGGEVCGRRRVGFRSVETKNAAILLNGAPIRLNGCCYVYDSPEYGLVMTREQLLRDLSEMKEAGVNAIRSHFPMDDKFYDLCDEMGFLVWIEPNIYCCKPSPKQTGTAFAQPDSVAMAQQMTREMIAGARSHPSVVIYALGNECNVDHPEAKTFFRDLAALVRAEDPTRLVGYAALYGLIGDMGDLLDVIGMNSYYGWYDKISDRYVFRDAGAGEDRPAREPVDLTAFHDMVREAEKRLPADLPILLTEFGADAVPGCHSSADDLWSEEYQAKVIGEMIRASYAHPRICGTFQFAFIDYNDPSKPCNGYWNGLNLKGVLTYDRSRRASFHAMRECYRRQDGPAEN